MTGALGGLPLPLVLLFTIGMVLAAIELGYHIGLSRSRSQVFDSEALLSAITGANLALLAFIMAFSFSQAANHHKTRKQLVLEEANAISTAYLLAGLRDSAQGERIRELLVDYVDTRLVIVQDRNFTPEDVIVRSLTQQGAIWQEVQQLARREDIDELDGLLVDSITSLFEYHERRVTAGVRNRIPISIWVALSLLLVLSMLGIGNFSGLKGRRNFVSNTTLALSFSLVMYLIADLDSPTGGLVQPDHSAMLQLEQRMKRSAGEEGSD